MNQKPLFRLPRARRAIAVAFFAATAAGAALAAPPATATPAGAPSLKAPTNEAIARAFPKLPSVSEVRAVGNNSGLYELRVGKRDLYYTTQGATHLIRGEILESSSGRNITAERMAELSAVDFSTLDMKDAFKIVKGDGKRKLATFEDPNCGYCKKLTQELQKIDNATVYVFLYPVLGQDSQTKSRNIWCAKDPAATYTDWMLNGTTPPQADCDASALERNKRLGRDLGVQGTPALVFEDGRLHGGYVDAQRLNSMLR